MTHEVCDFNMSQAQDGSLDLEFTSLCYACRKRLREKLTDMFGADFIRMFDRVVRL
jgi:hypothetical protein